MAPENAPIRFPIEIGRVLGIHDPLAQDLFSEFGLNFTTSGLVSGIRQFLQYRIQRPCSLVPGFSPSGFDFLFLSSPLWLG
jgi:hypothetical protein